MLRRIVRVVLILPAVLALAAIGVANMQSVRLALNPFQPHDPALSLELPFFAWLILAAVAGVMAGGLATWRGQAHWRRSARRGEAETRRWKAETDRLGRERQLELT